MQHHFFKHEYKVKIILWSKTIISANVLAIKTLDLNHVPIPGIIPSKFLWTFDHSFNEL